MARDREESAAAGDDSDSRVARTDLRRARSSRHSVRRYGDRHPRAGCIGLVAHSPLHRRAPRRRQSRPAARLAIVDAMPIDNRRKLVIVRRDNVEHLILISGPSDVVVEPAIVRTRTGAPQQPRPATAAAPRRAQTARKPRRPRRRLPRRRRHSPRCRPVRSSSPRPTTHTLCAAPGAGAAAPPRRRARRGAAASPGSAAAAPAATTPDASRLGCGRNPQISEVPSERNSRPSALRRAGAATRVEQVTSLAEESEPAMSLPAEESPPVAERTAALRRHDGAELSAARQRKRTCAAGVFDEEGGADRRRRS